MSRSDEVGFLLAICLNPPRLSSGTRTLRAVEVCARIFGCESGRIVNLCSTATASVVELNERGLIPSHWTDQQTLLREAIQHASVVVGAWGVSGLSGEVRKARDAQAAWVAEAAVSAGHREIWCVGGEPRHPSRWHQYTADRHGRTSGGSLEERLREVMTMQMLTPATLEAVASKSTGCSWRG